MSFLSSFIPGRFRLRSSLLQWPEAAEVILSALRACPAVTETEHNPRTGGVLIHYRPSELPLSKALAAKPLFDRLTALQNEPRSDAVLQQVKDLCRELLNCLS